MKILHIHNLMQRKYGNFNSNYGKKFNNGLIKNNHHVIEFSDRDLLRYEAPLKIRPLGKKILNRKLLETCDHFEPDAILIGHSNLIEAQTLQAIYDRLPKVKIAHWNLDALWIESNLQRLKFYGDWVDTLFISTGKTDTPQLSAIAHKMHFIPNPCDPAIEIHDHSQQTELEHDLIFCGVGSANNYRPSFLKALSEQLPSQMRFKCCGIYGEEPVWGKDYQAILAQAKMGLNLNSFEGWPLYSSDRIAQLIGNGILSFLWDRGGMRRLFNDSQVVFFNSVEDCAEKARYYYEHDDERQKIAAAGRAFYHEQFSGERITQYMLDVLFNQPETKPYMWTTREESLFRS